MRRSIRVLLALALVASAAAPALAEEPVASPAEMAGTSLYTVARRIGVLGQNGRVVVPHTGEGVTIALIDTGVAPVSGLANSKVVLGPDFTPEDQFDELRSLDTNGHGTHLAGIMVATDPDWAAGERERSEDRTIGIAPDATLLSIKAGAADGGTDVTQVIAAINWVVAQKKSGETDIDILNLAFSTDSSETYLTDPLTYAVERAWNAGIVVVVAAGNEGREATQLTSPARDPFVIAVGASELTTHKKKSEVADFTSNGIERSVDVHAPGQSVISLRNPGSYSDDFNSAGRVGDDLVRASGTSQATAVTSAAIALLLEARPELTPDEVKEIVIETATIERSGATVTALHLDATKMSRHQPDNPPQSWAPATGAGSIDQSRGDFRPTLDGVELVGDTDVFGNDWSESLWTIDAWTGSRWTGSRWTTDVWANSSWSGSRWTGVEWSGSRWTGSRWTGDGWTGSRWTGSRWTGSRWTGSRWTGSRWTAVNWS